MHRPPRAGSRPRRIGDRFLDAVVANSALEGDASDARKPELRTAPAAMPLDAPENPARPAGLAPEEVGEGEVIRIDTNLVTVLVSGLDRQGRYISIYDANNFAFLKTTLNNRSFISNPPTNPSQSH